MYLDTESFLTGDAAKSSTRRPARVGCRRRVVIMSSLTGPETISEGAHTLQLTRVQRVDLDAVEIAERGAGGVWPSCWHQDVSACPAQRTRSLQADAGIAAGHDRELAREVDAAQNFVGSAASPIAGADLLLSNGHDSQARPCCQGPPAAGAFSPESVLRRFGRRAIVSTLIPVIL
jgi:hypothetical protein